MKIKIVNKSKHDLPSYSTDSSAGMGIRTNIDSKRILKPHERSLVKAGLFLEYRGDMRPRFGQEVAWQLITGLPHSTLKVQ